MQFVRVSWKKVLYRPIRPSKAVFAGKRLGIGRRGYPETVA
jgi:hypothetical protein